MTPAQDILFLQKVSDVLKTRGGDNSLISYVDECVARLAPAPSPAWMSRTSVSSEPSASVDAASDPSASVDAASEPTASVYATSAQISERFDDMQSQMNAVAATIEALQAVLDQHDSEIAQLKEKITSNVAPPRPDVMKHSGDLIGRSPTISPEVRTEAGSSSSQIAEEGVIDMAAERDVRKLMHKIQLKADLLFMHASGGPNQKIDLTSVADVSRSDPDEVLQQIDFKMDLLCYQTGGDPSIPNQWIRNLRSSSKTQKLMQKIISKLDLVTDRLKIPREQYHERVEELNEHSLSGSQVRENLRRIELMLDLVYLYMRGSKTQLSTIEQHCEIED